MPRTFALLSCLVLATAVATAQVIQYGSPSPAGFLGQLDGGGQIPFDGSTSFGFAIHGTTNNYGGAFLVNTAASSVAIGPATFLLDPTGVLLFPIPPGVTQIPLLLNGPASLAGVFAYGQAGFFDPSVPGGLGLTNGIVVTVLPRRTPTRMWVSGQSFAGGPGCLTSFDLSVQPPVVRASGSLGFTGGIGSDFSPKVAICAATGLVYALGNSSVNQFVRVVNAAADPVGIVTWPMVGDIPLVSPIASTVGVRDLEVMPDNTLLFATSGDGSSSFPVTLQVFDITNVLAVVPQTAIQTIAYPNSGIGPVQLEISPDGTKLAVANAADSQPTLRLYQIQYGAVPPLTQIGTWSLGGFSGYSDPGDVHFAPDGSFVFLSGGNGRFSLLDLTTTPPTLRSNAAVWSTAPATGFHGAGIAISNGAPVAVMGEEGSSVTVRYRLIDLNVSSSTYGTELTNFTTNAAGNISNHRLHGSQNIVVGIDGTGATADCQWVDVMDLDQPQPGGGFASWRVKMPTALSLTISGITSIPRDFSIY